MRSPSGARASPIELEPPVSATAGSRSTGRSAPRLCPDYPGSEPAADAERSARDSHSAHVPPPFGPNEWLVDELYEQYQRDRDSVDPAWWDFFADYKPGTYAQVRDEALKAGATVTDASTGETIVTPPSTNGTGQTIPDSRSGHDPRRTPQAQPPRRHPRPRW